MVLIKYSSIEKRLQLPKAYRNTKLEKILSSFEEDINIDDKYMALEENITRKNIVKVIKSHLYWCKKPSVKISEIIHRCKKIYHSEKDNINLFYGKNISDEIKNKKIKFIINIHGSHGLKNLDNINNLEDLIDYDSKKYLKIALLRGCKVEKKHIIKAVKDKKLNSLRFLSRYTDSIDYKDLNTAIKNKNDEIVSFLSRKIKYFKESNMKTIIEFNDTNCLSYLIQSGKIRTIKNFKRISLYYCGIYDNLSILTILENSYDLSLFSFIVNCIKNDSSKCFEYAFVTLSFRFVICLYDVWKFFSLCIEHNSIKCFKILYYFGRKMDRTNVIHAIINKKICLLLIHFEYCTNIEKYFLLNKIIENDCCELLVIFTVNDFNIPRCFYYNACKKNKLNVLKLLLEKIKPSKFFLEKLKNIANIYNYIEIKNYLDNNFKW